MAKSILRIIGEGTLWTSGSTVILKIIGLATIFLILHRLSVYEYGLIELVGTVVPLFGFFLLPGLSNVVIADMGVARAQGDKSTIRTIFSHYVLVQSTLGVIAWAVVFFGADVISRFYEGQAPNYIKIVSFAFLTGPIRASMLAVFRVYLKYFVQSVQSVVEATLKLTFLVLSFFVFHWGIPGVLWSGIVAEALGIFVMTPAFLKIYRDFKDAPLHSLSFWSLLKNHGKWSVFAGYFNSFGQNMRLWLIKAVLGTEAVGLFGVAFGLFSHTSSLIPLGNVLGPVLPQYLGEPERLHKIVGKGVKYQFLAFAILGVLGLFVFTPIIAFLFPKYISSLPVFQIMLIALLPLAFASVFTPLFFALKAQKSLFWAIGVKNIAILIFAPLFMWAFGIVGLGIELVLTTAIFVFERYRVLKRILPGFALKWRDFISVDQDDRVIIAKFMRRLGIRRADA